MSTLPKNPVTPVMNTERPEKKSGMVVMLESDDVYGVKQAKEW